MPSTATARPGLIKIGLEPELLGEAEERLMIPAGDHKSQRLEQSGWEI